MEPRAAPPVIDLSRAHNGDFTPGRPRWFIALWMLCEWLLVTNPLQVSSALRAAALRLFGASIGRGVLLRPRLRVKFPWRLKIGDRSWIGEGVWIHNQGEVEIGHDAVLSQETFVTTGSHRFEFDMSLVVAPVRIGNGAWIASRCLVLQGVDIGDNAMVAAGSVVSRSLAPDGVYAGQPARLLRARAAATTDAMARPAQ